MDCFKYNFALVSRIASSFSENSSFDVRAGHKVNLLMLLLAQFVALWCPVHTKAVCR